MLGAASYVYSVLKERYPRVLAVNQVCPYTYVIQFKPRVPGESTRLALMALGSFADRIKNVILVDDDIDPFDLSMVMFAISTRTDADSAQVQIIRDLQANRQDPSTEKYLRVGGLIIDSHQTGGQAVPGYRQTARRRAGADSSGRFRQRGRIGKSRGIRN